MMISTEPATGNQIWRGKVGNVDRAMDRAVSAKAGWARESTARRMELVRRFANEVLKHADPFAELIARETGKPLWEARTEVEAVKNKVEISITAFAERTGQKKMDSALQGTAALRHKPHGVMAVLGPYNFPAHLPNGHIVPALIAGNVVVFKPSEKTPAVGEFLTKLFHEAGIPEDVIQCVHGGADIGKALVAHPSIDGLLFTGSAPAGIAINKKLAGDPSKIVALEMGGNNPIVMMETPKIEDAAVTIIQSAFTTAGQRCTAARRLIVPDSFYDQIVPAVKTLAERLLVDEPFADPQPFMGTVIDNQAADLLVESREALLERGGEDILAMTRPNANLPFLTPGIIDVTAIADRPDVELFGPLLQVIRVADFDAAIAEANNTRYGLSASLIGGDPKDFDRFWAEIRAGIVNWNKPTNGASSAAPFGGIGLSGNHRPAAFYAADYCAYPVASTETDQPRASIGIGLKDTSQPVRKSKDSHIELKGKGAARPFLQGFGRRPLRPEGRLQAAGGHSLKLVQINRSACWTCRLYGQARRRLHRRGLPPRCDRHFGQILRGRSVRPPLLRRADRWCHRLFGSNNDHHGPARPAYPGEPVVPNCGHTPRNRGGVRHNIDHRGNPGSVSISCRARKHCRPSQSIELAERHVTASRRLPEHPARDQ